MAAPVQVMLGSEVAEAPLTEAGLKRIRTVVVDDSPTFLQVACALLELDPLIDLVARAGKGGEAIETVFKVQPELVVRGGRMPYLDGLARAWPFTILFLAGGDGL